MRIKLLIISAFATLLIACGSDLKLQEPTDPLPPPTPAPTPEVSVAFDPLSGVTPFPSAFFRLSANSVFDGTLETESADEFSGTDPFLALGALDGWSVIQPITIGLTSENQESVYLESLNSLGVRVFEASNANSENSSCESTSNVELRLNLPCEIVRELASGTDYYLDLSAGSSVVISPMIPFRESMSYLVVITSELHANGASISSSEMWQYLLDFSSAESVPEPELRPIKSAIDAYISLLSPLVNEDIVFASHFSTSSSTAILESIIADNYPSTSDFPVIELARSTPVTTAFDIIKSILLSPVQLQGLEQVELDSCNNLITVASDESNPLQTTAIETLTNILPYCVTEVHSATVQLPHFLSLEEPMLDWMRGRCTSPVIVDTLGEVAVSELVGNQQVGVNHEDCQTFYDAYDLDLTELGLTDQKHLTGKNPIPQRTGLMEDGTQEVPIFVTLPDTSVIEQLTSIFGAFTNIDTSQTSFPTVIMQHGITSRKEETLPLTGILSMNGYATVAMDLPLHGDRGVTVGGIHYNTSTALGGVAQVYMNLLNLLTARDNLRQSIVDIVGLRASINSIEAAFFDNELAPSSDEVYFIGHSLGAISGLGALSLTNSQEPGWHQDKHVESDLAFDAAVLASPSGGIANFLFESREFSDFIKANLTLSSVDGFSDFVEAYAITNGMQVSEAEVPAFLAFIQDADNETLGQLETLFGTFASLFQHITDATDPISNAYKLNRHFPTLMFAIKGGLIDANGDVALQDGVIPYATKHSLSGSKALAETLGLSPVIQNADSRGLVSFGLGHHGSIINPIGAPEVTQEMQSLLLKFLSSDGAVIEITNTEIVVD